MKKLLVCLLLSLLFCANLSYAQQKPIPPYAKWSVMALEKTKEKYPNANIVDYLHIRRDVRPTTSTEKFKFWLKEKDKEFGVFVDVEFNNKTEKVISINFRETSR